jgi:single-strand DNA-binding protein
MSARSLNKVMLIGNLTRDPELRYTPSGTAVCTFGLATNRTWTPSDGAERQEETEYHRIVAWSKLAEICSQLLYKGRKVYVEGRLQTRKWTGQDGNERETTEVVIDSMIALGAPKNGGGKGSFDDEYEYEGFDQYSANGSGQTGKSQANRAQAQDDQAGGNDDQQAPAQQPMDEDVSADDIPF